MRPVAAFGKGRRACCGRADCGRFIAGIAEGVETQSQHNAVCEEPHGFYDALAMPASRLGLHISRLGLESQQPLSSN